MLLGKYYFVYLQQLLGEILRLFISKLIFYIQFWKFLMSMNYYAKFMKNVATRSLNLA